MSVSPSAARPARPAIERRTIAAAGLTLVLLLVCHGATLLVWRAAGRTDPPPAEWVSGLALLAGPLLAWTTGLAARIARSLPDALDHSARRHWAVTILCASFAVLALVQTARVSAFMVDPHLTRDAAKPMKADGKNHMCLTAYVQAGELARARVPNLYEASHYTCFASDEASRPKTSVEHMQEYLWDAYEYPPPFVVLPRAALAVTNDYRVVRALWFIVQALALGALMVGLARWIGGREGLVAGLLIPAVWSSMPFWGNLQAGQLHLLSVALALAGMAAFERRRDVLGGSLLGAAIITKLAPGLLLLYLLGRGRVRAVVATAVCVAVYGLVGLAVLGPAPYVAFVEYHLPRVASGEAFAFAVRTGVIAGPNLGIYGLPLKLAKFGVPGMTTGVSSVVTWIYGVLLLPVSFLAARRGSGAPIDQAQRWLALLNLAAMRSPLAPYFYVMSGTVWLLVLLAATARRRRTLVVLGVAWIAASLFSFVKIPDQLEWTSALVAVLALNLWVALRGSPVAVQEQGQTDDGADSGHPPSAAPSK